MSNMITGKITTHEAIFLIFIIFIGQANIKLVAKVVRTPLFYQKVRLLTILSLAIGDLILALFSLAVNLVLFYIENYDFLEKYCRLRVTSNVYSNYLLHFVYSIGLIVLLIEVMLRKESVSSSKNTIAAIFTGSLPWIIGLCVVLPQCLSSVDYEACIDSAYYKSLIAVSIIGPASLTIIMSLLFNCCKLPYSRQVRVLSTNVQLNYFHPDVDRNQCTLQNGNCNNVDRASVPLISSQTSNHVPQVTLTNSRDPTSQHSITQFNSNQNCIVQQSEIMQVENEVLKHKRQRRKELKVLAFISIVVFVMIVPYYGYVLEFNIWHEEYDRDDLVVYIAVSTMLYWLTLARSFVTPMMFAYFF